LSKIKSNTVNKRKLIDLVSESMILSEVSLYGCPQVDGKTYGYNPVTKQCVEITDYEGPEKPEKSSTGGEPEGAFVSKTKADVIDKPGYDFDMDGLEDLFEDVPSILSDWEKIEQCVGQHPVATLGGLILGSGGQLAVSYNGFTKVALKSSKFGVKAAYKTGKFAIKLISGNLIKAALLYGTYKLVADDDNTLPQNIRKVLTLGFPVGDSVKKFIRDNTPLKVSSDPKKSDELGKILMPDIVRAIDETVNDVENWTDINRANVSCATAAIIGAAATTFLLKKGTMPVVRTAAGAAKLVGGGLKNKLAASFGRIITKFSTKTDQISLFIALQRAGKIGGDVKFLTKMIDGKPTITLSRDVPTVVVKLGDLGAGQKEMFKKLAVNGEVTLDPTKLKKQIADISDDAIADTANIYKREAASAAKSGVGKETKRMLKLVGRGQAVNRVSATQNFFKQSGAMFDDLIRNNKPQVEALYRELLDIKKLEKYLKISRDAKGAFLKGSKSAGEFADNLIDIGKVPASRRDDLVNYLTKLKEATKKEQIMTTQLTQVQKLLDEEAVFAKSFGGNSKTSIKKDFLNTGDASGLIAWQKKMREFFPTFKEVLASTSLIDVMRKTYLAGKVGGGLYVGYKARNFIGDTDKRVAKDKVVPIAEEFAKYITVKRYQEGRVGSEQTVNSDKIFLDFYNNVVKALQKESDRPVIKDVLRIIKDFSTKAKNSKEIEEFFNAESAINRNDDLLQQKFIAIIEQEFGEEATTNEVKIMKKNDLMRLVSEVLNENSGQGYGKYPYHLNEPSEEEADEDYQTEWTALVDEVCGHRKNNVDGDPKTFEDLAVEVAKLFVKDSELFREVLEMAGSNKSIGVEIMQQLKSAKEKKNLDKELDV